MQFGILKFSLRKFGNDVGFPIMVGGGECGFFFFGGGGLMWGVAGVGVQYTG